MALSGLSFALDAPQENMQLWVLLVDDSGEIRFVQAGHPPPLVVPGGGQLEFLGKGGLPIGLVPNASYSRFQTKLS